MKNIKDLLNIAAIVVLEEENTKNKVNSIVSVLEATEEYLGRKLNEQEVNFYADLLIEADQSTERKQEKLDSAKTDVVFKKGSYTIEITTSEGKIKRKATSQKGILDVVHGEKNFRILDSNNRDITAKVKAFIKQRQKEESLRKKYGKKKKKILAEGAEKLVKIIPGVSGVADDVTKFLLRLVGAADDATQVFRGSTKLVGTFDDSGKLIVDGIPIGKVDDAGVNVIDDSGKIVGTFDDAGVFKPTPNDVPEPKIQTEPTEDQINAEVQKMVRELGPEGGAQPQPIPDPGPAPDVDPGEPIPFPEQPPADPDAPEVDPGEPIPIRPKTPEPDVDPGEPIPFPGKPPARTPKKSPDEAPEEIPGKTPEEAPEKLPEKTPEELPSKTPEELPGITPEPSPGKEPSPVSPPEPSPGKKPSPVSPPEPSPGKKPSPVVPSPDAPPPPSRVPPPDPSAPPPPRPRPVPPDPFAPPPPDGSPPPDPSAPPPPDGSPPPDPSAPPPPRPSIVPPPVPERLPGIAPARFRYTPPSGSGYSLTQLTPDSWNVELANADPIDPVLTKDSAFQGVDILGILGGKRT